MGLTANLRAMRPSMKMVEFLTSDAQPRYEGTEEFRDQRGDFRKWRVYTVGGHTVENGVFLAPGWIPAGQADTIAQVAILETKISGKHQAIEPEQIIDIPGYRGDPLSGEQRALVDRILAG